MLDIFEIPRRLTQKTAKRLFLVEFKELGEYLICDGAFTAAAIAAADRPSEIFEIENRCFFAKKWVKNRIFSFKMYT